jgi:probable blue pigment (indigoidine) exporter
MRLVLVTAAGPTLWGTNYLVTTELLPPGRPLLAGTIRALPAGLLLLAFVGIRFGRLALPTGSWWWRAAVLGTLNIGLFFALFFVAAYRLPGGVAAVLGAIGPFLVAGFAYPLLRDRPTRRLLIAAAIGVAGVCLLVLRSSVALDPIGLAAATGGVITMSLATVLGRRWGLPHYPSAAPSSPAEPSVPAVTTARPTSPAAAVLALTAWQLIAGGLLLLPVALLVEGPPPALSAPNLLGFGYLTLVGTALAHFLWFRGVSSLAPTRVTLLALLSPVVATILGWLVLNQSLSAGQFAGAAAVLGAVLLGVAAPASRVTRAPSPPAVSVARPVEPLRPLDTARLRPIPLDRTPVSRVQ